MPSKKYNPKYCATYHAKYKDTPEYKQRKRNHRLFYRYGIRQADYDQMYKAQNGLCRICHEPPKYGILAVDHCHATGTVRGLLCTGCNRKLAWYEKHSKEISLHVDLGRAYKASECESEQAS